MSHWSYICWLFTVFVTQSRVILEIHWLRSQPRFCLSKIWCRSVEVVELLCILNSPSSLALLEELNVFGRIRNLILARVAYSGSLICTFLLDDFPWFEWDQFLMFRPTHPNVGPFLVAYIGVSHLFEDFRGDNLGSPSHDRFSIGKWVSSECILSV